MTEDELQQLVNTQVMALFYAGSLKLVENGYEANAALTSIALEAIRQSINHIITCNDVDYAKNILEYFTNKIDPSKQPKWLI